ncbi:Crp/Fnr family transcriptional regulator [Alsobacter sp. SYSU M60028]|uniref:Crp/Fnr family transcriptional regulator n=1 Tax=Alsobacter ponti TaxID=2962936 RepID=A0ABT1LDG4_9HYPH|nr:Crp/Fnr family transcriptional regulator [Alsobacter ponti]MCP8938976.1 Crp/Fnr family transcriptional regulator [Alsobacter ponti]
MGIESEIQSLQSIPMFRDVETARLKLIAFTSMRLTVLPGRDLFTQGQVSDSAYIILEGEADVLLQNASGGRVIAQLGKNALVGDMGVILGEPRSATIRAATRLEVMQIPRENFLSLACDMPSIALSVMRELARRVQAGNIRIAELMQQVEQARG